jgi:hypothetical protein
VARVSYGLCKQCRRARVLYQGAEFCSPRCNEEAFRVKSAFSFDTETALMRPYRLAPPLACVSWARGGEYGLLHVREARDFVLRMLNSGEVLSAFNAAYDMTVFCAEWPDMVPLIFDVYWANRVSDTMLREQLKDIAEGTFRWGEDEGDTVRLNYNLEEVARRRCGVKLEKGTWQLRFGELIEVPLEQWPEEAKSYAVLDARANDGVWHVQQREDEQRDVSYFLDEFRQSRAAFWLHLMSCWGFHTSEPEVRAFAQKAQQNYERLRDELVIAGIVKKSVKRDGSVKYTKKKAPVQDLVEQEANRKSKHVPLTKTAEARLKKLLEIADSEKVPAKRAAIQRRIDACLQSVATDKDVCSRADHPLLKKYAELSHWEHVLGLDVPLVQMGVRTPIHGKFGLADTGRTTSSVHFGKGNTQNWSTSNGMRECAMPRPGYVYAIGDYSGFELRTWSQICMWMFGRSKMAKMLNEGLDPHLEMASKILHIDYDVAKAGFAQDPKGQVYLARQTGKVGNFGLPGGLGALRLVEYGRKNYNVIITPEEAYDLKEFWLKAWPEASQYLAEIKSYIDKGYRRAKMYKSERYRGGLVFTEYANGFFQALAADAAKRAGFLIARACYADPTSILYGSRPAMFIHDEFVLEVLDDELASDKAHELARLMVEGASLFLPDVLPVVEPLLARRWSKGAKPVFANGRLVPWDVKKEAA